MDSDDAFGTMTGTSPSSRPTVLRPATPSARDRRRRVSLREGTKLTTTMPCSYNGEKIRLFLFSFVPYKVSRIRCPCDPVIWRVNLFNSSTSSTVALSIRNTIGSYLVPEPNFKWREVAVQTIVTQEFREWKRLPIQKFSMKTPCT